MSCADGEVCYGGDAGDPGVDAGGDCVEWDVGVGQDLHVIHQDRWGSSRSRRFQVHSDSISTRPGSVVR